MPGKKAKIDPEEAKDYVAWAKQLKEEGKNVSEIVDIMHVSLQKAYAYSRGFATKKEYKDDLEKRRGLKAAVKKLPYAGYPISELRENESNLEVELLEDVEEGTEFHKDDVERAFRQSLANYLKLTGGEKIDSYYFNYSSHNNTLIISLNPAKDHGAKDSLYGYKSVLRREIE